MEQIIEYRSTFDANSGQHNWTSRPYSLCLILVLLTGLLPVANAQKIAFNEPDVLGPDVYVINSDGTGLHRLPISPESMTGADQPVWSRNGRALAVTGAVADPNNIIQMDTNTLAIYNLTTGRLLVPIGSNAPVSPYYIYKAFSPDGTKMAWASLQLDYVDFGVMSLTGTPQSFPQIPGLAILPNPAGFSLGSRDNTQGLSGFGLDWSPVNSSLLAASSTALSYDCNVGGTVVPASVTKIFLLQPTPGGLNKGVALSRPLQPCLTQVYDLFPAFSPDGTKVAYVRIVQDQSQLYGTPTTASIRVINTNGTTDHNVASFPEEFLADLSWSPDGSKLIFDRTPLLDGVPLPGQGNGIWTINPDGSSLREVLNSPASKPSWSLH